jgi:hypothetical protein
LEKQKGLGTEDVYEALSKMQESLAWWQNERLVAELRSSKGQTQVLSMT